MLILQLNGGLGNQMFQYAFGRTLSQKYGLDLYIDCSRFQGSNRSYSLDLFQISPNILAEINFANIAGYTTKFIQESEFGFNEYILNCLDENDLTRTVFIVCGYWQSYKYFLPIFSLLKKQYRLFYDIDTIYIPIQQAINDSESVMVHVRRGDYLYRGNFEKHGVVDVNYIETGMNYYREVLSDPLFFIFSDDIEWCAVNIKMSMDVIFVKKDHDEGRSSFCLMRQCKYFLISNSTYSWWAAWLSNYSKKQVICPRRWFRTEDIDSSDLIPSDWKLL